MNLLLLIDILHVVSTWLIVYPTPNTGQLYKLSLHIWPSVDWEWCMSRASPHSHTSGTIEEQNLASQAANNIEKWPITLLVKK